jgi:hypothetical protein
MRTSREELQQMVVVLNNNLPRKGKQYELEYTYGAPRLVLVETVSPYGARNISPRLPAGQLKLWLSAFIDGINEGRHR